MQPFEENVAITKKVVDTAHAVGLSVEGELGTIGKTDERGRGRRARRRSSTPTRTTPSTFVEQTGVDSLAIAIGTCHGLYPKHVKPELKLDLLKEIKALLPIPLVLHGGSGNPDDEIGAGGQARHQQDQHLERHQGGLPRQDARGAGGRPDAARAATAIQPPCIEAMKEVAAQKIDLFDAAGKADLY